MDRKSTRNALIAVYVLAGLLATFSIATFFYQYVAALGSLSAVIAAFGSDRLVTALTLSVLSAIVTAILGLVFGVPLAYIFATRNFPAKSLIETLTIDVPQTFPPIAEGMIFLLMLGPDSPFHVNLAFTFTALVIAKFFISVPFVISFAARRFREIEKTGMATTARALGADDYQVFTSIYLPLSVKDIAAGTTLCWSRAMGELGGSLLFAGVIPSKTETIPTLIATQATTLTTLSLAATILVTTASTAALLSFKKLTSGDEKK